MNPMTRSTIGFAVPTVLLITALHLARTATFSEAVDGVISGLWFTGLFYVGMRLAGTSLDQQDGNERRDLILGMAAGALTWALMAFGWSLPGAAGLDQSGLAFPINTAIVLGIGAVFALAGRAFPSREGLPG